MLEQLYWNDDPDLPLLEGGKRKRYTAQEAVSILMRKDTSVSLCKKQPVRVRQNAAFLVDISSLKHWEDVINDMNGVYDKILHCGTWTIECDLRNAQKVCCSTISKKKMELENDNQYHFVVHSKCNKACPDLIRSMFMVKDGNGDIVNGRILLQYHISSGEDEGELKVGRQGNSKRKDKAPFYPTAKSTKELMKQQLKDHAPSQVYKNMVDMVGGPSGTRTPGELPRSIKQVSDFNEKCQPKEDPVDDLMNYARHKEQVVLRHEDIPVDLWVLGTDTMCKDVGRLSSSESLSHPISIDPTFNMGQYEVTPIVYKHLLLASKRTGESPIFLGPTMLHHKKNVDTYKVFAATCVASCKGLEKAKGYTDGEAALDRAWKTELTKATYLRCLRHFKGNCQQKLRELGVREAKSQKFFLDKVFGVHDKTPGLVDCETMKEVKQTVKEEFDAREKEILNKKSTYEPRFSKYLWDSRHIIGKSIALEPRRKAGMPLDGNGIPLRPSEAMNNVMAQAKKRFFAGSEEA